IQEVADQDRGEVRPPLPIALPLYARYTSIVEAERWHKSYSASDIHTHLRSARIPRNGPISGGPNRLAHMCPRTWTRCCRWTSSARSTLASRALSNNLAHCCAARISTRSSSL